MADPTIQMILPNGMATANREGGRATLIANVGDWFEAQGLFGIYTQVSPLFGFTEDEVASLRIGSRHTNLYKAVLAAEERGDAHCADFLTSLRGFRTLSVSMGAGELLRRIYEETSYDAIVGAMPLGEQRVANLQLLLQYADSYDANSSYGVSGFVRYMDRLGEQDSSLGTAATLSPNANVVQIMSIHKSKGLEFRVCIVADLNHRFNDSELNRKLILHPELGIGLQGRQPDTGFTYTTLCHSAIREASLRSERSDAGKGDPGADGV